MSVYGFLPNLELWVSIRTVLHDVVIVACTVAPLVAARIVVVRSICPSPLSSSQSKEGKRAPGNDGHERYFNDFKRMMMIIGGITWVVLRIKARYWPTPETPCATTTIVRTVFQSRQSILCQRSSPCGILLRVTKIRKEHKDVYERWGLDQLFNPAPVLSAMMLPPPIYHISNENELPPMFSIRFISDGFWTCLNDWTSIIFEEMLCKNSCTCFRMYLRNAVLDHLPISMI